MARTVVLVPLVALLLAVAAGAASSGGSGRIVFATVLPEYPLPDNFQVDRSYVVGSNGRGLREVGLDEVFSPDGSELAAVRSGSEVWVSNAHGTDERKLAGFSGGTAVRDVKWSPDGSRLAFVADGIWVVGADGTGLRELFAQAASAPAWSPDGSRLAFAAGGLWVAGTDGTGLRELFAPPSGAVDRPEWSPDGSRLDITVGSDLWLVSADGAIQRLLFRPAAPTAGFDIEYFDDVEWAPSGSALAVTVVTYKGCSGDSNFDECVDSYALTFGRRGAPIGKLRHASNLRWSPDGTRVAFESPAPADPEEGTVDVARPDGRGRHALTPDLFVPTGYCWQSPLWLDATTVTVRATNCDFFFTYGTYFGFAVLRADNGSLVWRTRASSWAFSGDGKRVVFVKLVRGGSSAVFTANRDGTHERRLATFDYADLPVWSPDGRHVAFTAAGCCYLDLDNAPATGGRVRRLVRLPVDRTIDALSWTGPRLVYQSQTPASAVPDLWTMLPDGTDLRRLTANGLGDGTPSWSPDGTRIAFSRSTQTHAGVISAIYTVRPDGSGLRRIVGGPHGTGTTPSWSPDGKQLAYQRSSAIVVVNADGTGARQLEPVGFVSSSAWSPDGTEIAYAANGDIVVTKPDGTGGTTLLHSCCGPPAWSPDGSQLAFVCWSCAPANGRGIAVANADGSDMHLVTADAGPESPTWSPDGRELLYAGTSCANGADPWNGPPAICEVAADGTGLHAVTPPQVGSFSPSWTGISVAER